MWCSGVWISCDEPLWELSVDAVRRWPGMRERRMSEDDEEEPFVELARVRAVEGLLGAEELLSRKERPLV